jgi:hypothetical protein
MKFIYISACCALFVIAAGAVIFSVHSANQNSNLRSQWQAESKASKAKLAGLTGVAESSKESIAALQNKVSKLSGDLNKSVGELSAANDKIQAYALAEQNRAAEERKKYLASVPQPTFDRKIYFFPKVVGTNGTILATNATFAYITGRRLVFRPENETAIAVDVDNVHPLVLQYLGIDAEAVKLKKRQMDEADEARIKKDIDDFNQSIKARAAQYWADEKIRAEMAKADEEKRQKQQAAENERIKALAAAKAADAAMIEAQKPPSQINMIQQQQQQQR